MTEIDERQQKRAGRYEFRPDFRAYDVRGRADLYWNCIFGAARKHYDYAVFAQIFAGLQQYEDADTYTDLFWLGLENCVYQRELPQRPALEALRRRYAEQFVRQHQGAEDFQFYDSLALAHFSRVLGLESRMNKYDSKLLDELEFTPDMTETEIAARAKELFERWFQICTEERRRAQKRSFTQPFKKRGRKNADTQFRRFGLGFTQHPQDIYGGSTDGDVQQKELKTKMTAQELREQLTARVDLRFGKYFGSVGTLYEFYCNSNSHTLTRHNVILNAAAGRKFGKENRLRLSVGVIDILNRPDYATTSFDTDYIVTSSTSYLGRYGYLRIAYTF